jgi:hypothetical protein
MFKLLGQTEKGTVCETTPGCRDVRHPSKERGFPATFERHGLNHTRLG